MVLPTALTDREMQKFEEVDGDVAVRIKGTNFEGSVTVRGLTIGGRHSVVAINATTWTEVPASALTSRNLIVIQNNTGQDIKINYDDQVAGFVGILVRDGSERAYDIQGSIPIYVKCQTGTVNLDIEELA